MEIEKYKKSIERYLKTDINIEDTIENWIYIHKENWRVSFIVQYSDWIPEVLYKSQKFIKEKRRIQHKKIQDPERM